MWGGKPLGGGELTSGGGGGGGNWSRDDEIRPLVGVPAVGVLWFEGGAGGGWLGRDLDRVGVPPEYSDSELHKRKLISNCQTCDWTSKRHIQPLSYLKGPWPYIPWWYGFWSS